MNIELRRAIRDYVKSVPGASETVAAMSVAPDGTGYVTYNSEGLRLDPNAPGFRGATATLTDEEAVRAYLLVRLTTALGYPATPETLELEHVYKAVGRPGKGGRIDVLVRQPLRGRKLGTAFLFIETKDPRQFDRDLALIDGQLFRLSLQESPRPRYLAYFTVELRGGALRERLILVDTTAFASYEDWDAAGQPIVDVFPEGYGRPRPKRYANVASESAEFRPLDRGATAETFNRLRSEIHDVIWGGGGTNNNDVFLFITKLILCKIYDETETPPGKPYEFQRLGNAVAPERPSLLAKRMNALYKRAESGYLALPKPQEGPAFDIARISAEKIAYVVGRLESISVTENAYEGDLLGDFFEQIVAQDFTQTRGQFFTPIRLVRFILSLANALEIATDVMVHHKDHLGRPRLPFVIDPACGSGTFLIEYMKQMRDTVGSASVRARMPRRIAESHEQWFSGPSQAAWAEHYLFGIENNHDLGLAAKVNMVLHGDGSMNMWIQSALLPFSEYVISGRTNILGATLPRKNHPYPAERNEQFDLVISNPPFSLKMPPDEKRKVATAFDVMASARSEAIFVERWYQLLREGGQFCCVLPEAILDTGSSQDMRLFLLQNFDVLAVVSLPYDSFRPFTSSKTSVVLARKRTQAQVEQWGAAWRVEEQSGVVQHEVLQRVLRRTGRAGDQVFMAEPSFVGYKRRKNLPDLPMPNHLYREDQAGRPREDKVSTPLTVLDYYRGGQGVQPSPQLGFWTTLGNVASRPGFRLDPKYRWLWDYDKGLAHGSQSKATPLRDLLDIVVLPKVDKGELVEEAKVIDLEYVEARQAIVHDEVPVLDYLGSDKVRFDSCDLAFAKLEPYLAKIIIRPDADLGSTEWIGLRVKRGLDATFIAYLLMLPDVREAYRRLQSGKRHARLEPEEILDLRVELPMNPPSLTRDIERARGRIFELRAEELRVRAKIDSMFGETRPVPRRRSPQSPLE